MVSIRNHLIRKNSVSTKQIGVVIRCLAIMDYSLQMKQNDDSDAE